MFRTRSHASERGTILLIVLFIATAIAALAALSSGRVVAESRQQTVLEDDTRALNEAFARIHFAMNVVNNSEYDEENHNLVIRQAIAEPVEQLETDPAWMEDPDGVAHGMIPGTDVRLYRGRDYVKRLQLLRGDDVTPVDTLGESDAWFVLEAVGRSGDTDRLVSALIRESEPFSSFVFFQNLFTLGISGAPRGMIHSNSNLAFYFPNGRYRDMVSSVNGFEYRAGATKDNTHIYDSNAFAKEIELQSVDFADLKAKSDTYVGEDGLDAAIKMYRNGEVRITPYTPPRYELVVTEETITKITGYDTITYTVTEQVQVDTVTETRTREVPVYGTETYTVTVPVYENQEVTKTRTVPVYELQTVTKTRWVKVFVPFDGGSETDGGTTVGDGGEGILGEYVWVQEEYQALENVIIGYREETYTVTEPVQVGTTTEERTRTVITGYETETYTVDVPVYEEQTKEVTEEVPIYKTFTKVKEQMVYQPPVPQAEDHVWVNADPGTIFIDGRIVELGGEINGRLTIVGNEKVRITDDIRYVDDSGQYAMLDGNSTTSPYVRNPDYTGNSVLGVIARDDVLFTWTLSDKAEINATLMSVNGRVGADALWVDQNGELVQDSDWVRKQLLTPEQYQTEQDYDKSNFRTRSFVKDSMRRLGGIISNNRIAETYIRPRKDGTAYVAAGFKRGAMTFDFNLKNNPPPNFIEIPRPVMSYMMPVLLVRDETN